MTTPQLLRRSQINAHRWDQAIQNSEQRVIYGYSWYLDLVSPGWSALVWPSEDDYQVFMPLPTVKKWGVSIIRQPLFCQYLGLFSTCPLPEDLTLLFLNALNHHFRYISSYSFHPDNTEVLAPLIQALPAIRSKKLTTHWVRLHQPYTTIQSLYTQDRINNLKSARKANWQVQEQDDPLPLIRLFATHHASKINGGVHAKAYTLLEAIYKKLKDKDVVKLQYASLEGELHAGIMLVKEGDKTIYLFNAADEEGRRLNARTFLLDEYFRTHAGTDQIFDFESPEVASIAAFYRSFGAEEKVFYHIRKNSLPFPLSHIQEWRRKQGTTASEDRF